MCSTQDVGKKRKENKEREREDGKRNWSEKTKEMMVHRGKKMSHGLVVGSPLIGM